MRKKSVELKNDMVTFPVVLTLISIANRKAKGWHDAFGGCCRGTAVTSRNQAGVAIDRYVCTQRAEGQPQKRRKFGLKFWRCKNLKCNDMLGKLFSVTVTAAQLRSFRSKRLRRSLYLCSPRW